MALVLSKRSGRTDPPLKNVKKWLPKQNIAIFLNCRTVEYLTVGQK